MLKLLTVVMTVACYVTGVTSTDNDVPFDPLLTMFAKQELLLKNIERLMTNEISAIKGEIKNVKTGQGDLLQNFERLANDTLVAMTNERNVLKTNQGELSASVKDVKASLTSIKKIVDRLLVCPDGYYRSSYNNRCYKFYTTGHTWDEAKARCNSDGTHMVTFDSQGELDALIQLMTEKDVCCGFWIGGKIVNGRWTWVESNEPFTFTNWKSGFPGSVDGGKNCAYARMSNLYWDNDYPCSGSGGYVICEI